MPLNSRTDVCNMALAEIGARRINSIESDASGEAVACRLHFEHVVESLLRRHQWNFATARMVLSRAAAVPVSEWNAAWPLPGDFIRLIKLVGPISNFALEGRNLLTKGDPDITTLPIVYITSGVPVPLWDSLFVDAVVYKLAASINGSITKNPTLADACLQKLERMALPAAQTADAREVLSGENFGPSNLMAMSPLVRARLQASGGPSLRPDPFF